MYALVARLVSASRLGMNVDILNSPGSVRSAMDPGKMSRRCV